MGAFYILSSWSSSDCSYLAISPTFSVFYDWRKVCLHSFAYSCLARHWCKDHYCLESPGKVLTHPFPSHRDLGSDAFCQQPVPPILHPPALSAMMWWTQAGIQGSQFLHQAGKEKLFFFSEINIFTRAKPTPDREESGLDLCLSTCVKTYIRKWCYCWE